MAYRLRARTLASMKSYLSPYQRLLAAGRAGVPVGPSNKGGIPPGAARNLAKRGLAAYKGAGETLRVVSTQIEMFPDDGF